MGDRQLKKFVDRNLYDDQSPESIAGRIVYREKHLVYVSKDSIYRYIKSVYGRRIEFHRKRLRRRRRSRRSKRGKLSDRTFIDKRPKYIENRTRVGDVEADFVESGKSGKGILLVVADRKTRVSFLEQILTINIANVHKKFLRIKQRFPEMKTITTDNDILLQKHKKLERLLGVEIYFCHPYHSWEKGEVENTNGRIRKYIPKGSDISSYSISFIKNLEDRLNRKLMKCLKYRTPWETLQEVRQRRKKMRGKKSRYFI